jgi:ribonucleotide reductase beta subunit family protein with ferritin-like domain
VTVRTLTPLDLCRQFLKQRDAIRNGNRDEVYHAKMTRNILNAAFEMCLNDEELEAVCKTMLEKGERP